MELTKNIRRRAVISTLEPNDVNARIGINIFPEGYLNPSSRKASFISLNTIDLQMQQPLEVIDQMSVPSLPSEFSCGFLGISNEGYSTSHESDDTKSSQDTSF